MGSKYSILSVVSVFGVGITLAVTIFLVNQRQDIRQQASSTINAPSPTTEPEGCPDTNPDGRQNVCRSVAARPLGEIEKENGKSECTQKMGKLSRCCTIVTPQ